MFSAASDDLEKYSSATWTNWPSLRLPLSYLPVLDLDRTLIGTDLLFENFASALRKHHLLFFMVVWWIIRGKAVLKKRLVEWGTVNASVLPVNKSGEGLAPAETSRRRSIIITRAADEIVAHCFARHRHGMGRWCV